MLALQRKLKQINSCYEASLVQLLLYHSSERNLLQQEIQLLEYVTQLLAYISCS
jgi:hypothetical protein